jgi:hypothetical protein
VRINDSILVQQLDDDQGLVILDESTTEEVIIPTALIGKLIVCLEFFEAQPHAPGIIKRPHLDANGGKRNG